MIGQCLVKPFNERLVKLIDVMLKRFHTCSLICSRDRNLNDFLGL